METIFYPVVLTREEVGGYSVYVPDIDGCFTQGESIEDAYNMSIDAIGLMLYGMEVNGEPFPKPSDPLDIKLGKDESVMLVRFNMIEYKKKTETKSVKKTLTIPSWLNEMALAKKINFSQLLQDALMNELNINED